jgi:hypothetical protein
MRTISGPGCTLLATSLLSSIGCALIDPDRYVYSQVGGNVTWAELLPIGSDAGNPDDVRWVRVLVGESGCLPGCSTVLDSECEIVAFDGSELQLRWSVNLRTVTSKPGLNPLLCSTVCTSAAADCGIVEWLPGTDLRIMGAEGGGVTVAADSRLPVTVGYRR